MKFLFRVLIIVVFSLLAGAEFRCRAVAEDWDKIDVPKSLDDRFTVELFAAEPDIVTVTGLTVDAKGRVLVMESQTHFRPDDYEGPETDRIRLLEDTTGDGKADRVVTFFEGTTYTMNVACHPFNGWVYVASRSAIFRLKDTDDDGIADKQQRIATLETEADYPHNGLSGFAFDFAGNVFFCFGENMGEEATLIGGVGAIHDIKGTDSKIQLVLPKDAVRLPANYGTGGIFSCKPDGSQLKRFATGFWNPFDLCFDTYGRMFTGDNDPGNRPPCRFLSIVEGGDYGYRRKTLEPFIAVDGEVPGTLPMTSSTGESPTGILAYESENLPKEYLGDLLVATWGEHRIDRYQLKRDGASFRTTSQAMIAGTEHFRPAGIAVAPDGSLFIGDWADRSYPLHSKGRIWHVKSKAFPVCISNGLHSPDRAKRELAARQLIARGAEGIALLKKAMQSDANPRVRSLALAALISADAITPRLSSFILKDKEEAIREQAARTIPLSMITLQRVVKLDSSPAVQAAALRRIADVTAESLLLEKLTSLDPFMQQAARKGLSQSVTTARLVELLADSRSAVRLAVILLLRDSHHAEKLDAINRDAVITKSLQDKNEQVRFATLQWIGSAELKQFHQAVEDQITQGATTPQLFKAYLACLAQLDGVMQHWTKGTSGDWWMKKADSYRYAGPILNSVDANPQVIQQVLRFLPKGSKLLTLKQLNIQFASLDLGVQLDAVRRLRELKTEPARKRLIEIAKDITCNQNARAEAVAGLDYSKPAEQAALFSLCTGTDSLYSPSVKKEALRTLRGIPVTTPIQATLALVARTTGEMPADAETVELVSRIVSPNKLPERPNAKQLAKWVELLKGPADAAAGSRVFFHSKGPGCAKCHRIDGRGTAVGPSFVRVNGKIALTRKRLIEAILDPSKEVDPGYMPLMILTVDGKTASGIYHKHNGKIRQIYDSKGNILTFKIDEIEEMVPQKTSIMPDGLAKSITTQEFRDMLAYLLNEK